MNDRSAALLMIRKHGAAARGRALQLAANHRGLDDAATARLWVRVSEEIAVLEETEQDAAQQALAARPKTAA